MYFIYKTFYKCTIEVILVWNLFYKKVLNCKFSAHNRLRSIQLLYFFFNSFGISLIQKFFPLYLICQICHKIPLSLNISRIYSDISFPFGTPNKCTLDCLIFSHRSCGSLFFSFRAILCLNLDSFYPTVLMALTISFVIPVLWLNS